MKSIYRKFTILSLTIIAVVLGSCTDFLTIIPPDKIVHEQFWQTKDDVDGMLATSYLKLASTDAVERAIIWGELRADNLTYEVGKQKDDPITQFVLATVDSENQYTTWTIFYEAINYANLVIEYAPLVIDRDPNFTQGDLDVVLGEMYAMRALCHFYLLRTFRDIPVAMVPAVNDSELPDYKQEHPLEVLEMIMKDLDVAEKLVMPTGNYSDKRYNCGRFTKNAVLAIKADVNLWRAAFTEYFKANNDGNILANVDVQQYYTQCIANCREIMSNIDKIYAKNNPDNKKDDTPYHLYANHDDEAIKKGTYESLAFDKIFGDEAKGGENSRETIFELQIDKSLSEGFSNGIVSIYGCSDRTRKVEVPENFLKKYQYDDLRKYSYMDIPTGDGKVANIKVAKYISAASPATKNAPRTAKNTTSNWIVYRQTDVMLMMAEALILQRAAGEAEIKESFELVDAINRRSRVDSLNIVNPLKTPKDIVTAYELVMDERVRELAFEGKRWYDLVRRALRENSVEEIKKTADKLKDRADADALQNRMVSIHNLFLPINIYEIRFNKNLKQNPAYKTDDSSIGMNK